MCVEDSNIESELTRHVVETLEDRKIIYHKALDDPNSLRSSLCIDNMHMEMYLFIYNYKINMRLILPFSVEQYMSPIICIFNEDHNLEKAFSKLHINRNKGTVFFDYTYLVYPIDFNEEIFWKYWNSLIVEACDNYVEISHLSVGLMNNPEKQVLIELLNRQIEKLQINDSDQNISYGES